MAYSIDLRQKVIKYLKSGHSQREASKTFEISTSTINKWHQQYVATGNLEDKKPSRSFKKLDPKKLIEYVNENPDAFIIEIAEYFGCSDTAVGKALKKAGYTRKKRPGNTKNKKQS